METVILSLFIISSIFMVIIIFSLIKQRVFFLNQKTIIIFLAPLLFGGLFFLYENDVKSNGKQIWTNEIWTKEYKNTFSGLQLRVKEYREFLNNLTIGSVQHETMLIKLEEAEKELILKEPRKFHANSKFAIEVSSTYNFHELIDTGLDLSIKKNENFTKILKPYGVDEIQMYNLDNYLKKNVSFNLQRDIRAGKKYALFLSNKDSIKKVEYFAYEINAEKYLFVNLKDSIYAKIHTRKPIIKRKKITGIINSSLWISLEKSGLSTNLEIDAIVDEITEKIYPWTINFYKIYPEDRFKIIYDAKYINGKFYEIEKVHASIFLHDGKDNYAIAFSEGNTKDYEYYDQDGNNLRKFFLTAPVSYKRISSKFSNSRKHPVTGKTKAHKGTDFAATAGSEIYATADGVIEIASYTSANGYYVKIKHNNTYSTQYLHMQKKSKSFWEKNNIKPGKKIKQKDIIGYVGSTGLATGPHVCYRFWKNGEQVDPFKCVLPPSEPINQNCIADFNIERSKWVLKLDSMLYEDEIVTEKIIEVSSHHYP